MNFLSDAHSSDSPGSYVDAISKVCAAAQFLDAHLALLLGESHPSPYAVLDLDVQTHIQQRLRRTSDFFARDICSFILRDVGLLLDKHGASDLFD